MKRIGLDAGGSLIKLSYEEKGQLHLKTYQLNEKEKLTSWLQILAPQATIYGTGGNWNGIQKALQQQTEHVDEFPALIRGTNFLLEKEKHRLDEYILISMGTGTSIFHVKNEAFERIDGTGIGGGTWMGLGMLLAGEKTFQELVQASSEGNHEKSDLLVNDIYGKENAPLNGGLTAANFGKAHLSKEATSSDHLRALTQMIGEVTLTLVSASTQQTGVEDIVFVGSTLEGNKPLQEVLNHFHHILTYRPVFLEEGAYAGAIGAMIT